MELFKSRAQNRGEPDEEQMQYWEGARQINKFSEKGWQINKPEKLIKVYTGHSKAKTFMSMKKMLK